MPGEQKRIGRPPVGQDKIEAYGLDQVCLDLMGGFTLTEISLRITVDIATLINWIDKDSQRSARVREARVSAAKIWDERAQHHIENAGDPFELSKANSLAHHFRWRASKIAPRDYGDKQTVQHEGAVTNVNLDTNNAVDAAKSYRDIMGS